LEKCSGGDSIYIPALWGLTPSHLLRSDLAYQRIVYVEKREQAGRRVALESR